MTKTVQPSIRRDWGRGCGRWATCTRCNGRKVDPTSEGVPSPCARCNGVGSTNGERVGTRHLNGIDYETWR
jgi:hypothetical protein